MNKILEIKNLTIDIDNINILQNINLEIDEFDIISVIGPNGGGKSTLLKAIMGHHLINISSGYIKYQGKNISNTSIDARSQMGIFLANQQPIEIEGVSLLDFYKAIISQQNKSISILKLYKLIETNLKKVNFSNDILERSINVGFSGGEKKRNEIMQMLLLNPQLILIDEIDSGLDVDSLETIVNVILEEKKKKKTIVFITHNKLMLERLKPNKVILVANQQIAKVGDLNFGLNILNKGFNKILRELKIKKPKKESNICIGEHFDK